jgi:polyisoprenoid-binding protein YceI
MRRAFAAVVAGVVAVVVGFGTYFVFSGDEAPPPPRLSGRGEAAVAGPARSWRVAAGSFVGYRIDEEYLGGVGVKTAVGRTTAVSGALELDGRRIVSAQLEADLTSLRSDQSRRDDALRTRGIETARYPTARFSLLEPVAIARGGHARGLLMLHDHRAPVAVSLDARVADGRLELAGSAPIAFEDFAIEPPSVAGLVTVRSHGTLEFRLVARVS